MDRVETIWAEEEEDGTECELDRVLVENGSVKWQLSMTKGQFSGYPTINLTRKQLKSLFNSVGAELDLLESTMVEDRMSMLEEVVKDMRDKHVREIERVLKAMPAGFTLCVHDAVYEFDISYAIFSATTDAHVLDPGDECPHECRKTQYGPKGE